MSEIDWSKAPEGATHYWPGNSRFYEKVGDVYFVAGEQRYGYVHAPDSWVKKLIPRPSPAWSGEGLPPVGAVCEVKLQEEWALCEVIGHFQQPQAMVAAFTVWQFHGGKKLDSKIAECFRPIRTPEQIAADEREAAIDSMVQFFMNYYGNPKGAEQYLLICRSLHDAGYRKQEQQK